MTLNGELAINAIGALPIGQHFTIIDNDGNDAVNGTFAALPEGATLSTGSSQFRISYAGGDGNDVVLTLIAETAVSLSQSSAATQFGETVTLTATATSLAGTPTGVVTFTVDGASIGTASLQNGVATLMSAAIEPGTRQIAAVCRGTGEFGDSNAAAISHIVTRGATTCSLSSKNPVTLYGQDAEFTLTVTPRPPAIGVPSGFMTVLADNVAIGTAPVINGLATLRTAAVHTGTSSITARYEGDVRFEPSSAGGMQQVVGKAPTGVDARPRTPLFVGTVPAITAFVHATTNTALVPNGSVSVSEGGLLLGEQPLVDGVTRVTLPVLAPGDHTLTVAYSGGADFEPSSATATQTVALPAVAVAGASVTEGNSGPITLSFVATLSVPVSVPVRLSFSTLPGSATEDIDYEKASGVIEFAPGQRTHAIELHVIGDVLFEQDETFSVILSNAVNATIETPSALIVIVNDDAPPARKRPVKH